METKPYKVSAEVEKKCFSVDELGKTLGIGRMNAYELARSEGFPSITLGRRILIPIAGLERWLEAQTAKNDRVG